MGFNLNTRNTNNLRGSKEIDSIGDDLVNISSSLGTGFTPTIVWVKINDSAFNENSIFNFGHDTSLGNITVASQSAIPGGPNLIVTHSHDSSDENTGVDIFCSADGIYEVTADLILTIASGGTSGQSIYSVFVDSTKVYEMEARVNASDDPDKISFTYVGQITSGSKINVKIDPHDTNKITLNSNSTVTVQRIA